MEVKEWNASLEDGNHQNRKHRPSFRKVDQVKIETQDYSYSCGDGCCFNYGTILFIDGKQVEGREFGGTCDAYEYVLEHVLCHEIDYMESDFEENE